jgi:hypothetical protein
VRSAPTRGLQELSLRRPAEHVLVGPVPPALLVYSRPADQRLDKTPMRRARKLVTAKSGIRHDALCTAPTGICNLPVPAPSRALCLGRTALPACERRSSFAPNAAFCLRPTPLSDRAQWCLPFVLNADLRCLLVCAPRRAPLRRPLCTACAQRRLLFTPNTSLRLHPMVPSVCAQRRSPLLCVCARRRAPLHRLPCTASAQWHCFLSWIPTRYLRSTILSACTPRPTTCAQWCSPSALSAALCLCPAMLSARAQQPSPCVPNRALRVPMALFAFSQRCSPHSPHGSLRLRPSNMFLRIAMRPAPLSTCPTARGECHNDGKGMWTRPVCTSVLHTMSIASRLHHVMGTGASKATS